MEGDSTFSLYDSTNIGERGSRGEYLSKSKKVSMYRGRTSKQKEENLLK